MMRNQLLNSVCLCLLLASLSLTSVPAPAQNSQLLDAIVAVVDDDVILLSELRERLAKVRQRLNERQIEAPPEQELQRQVLDQLVLETLQLRQARRVGITIDDLALNNALKNMASQRNLTLDQLRRQLEASGRDYAEYREQIRQDIMLNQLSRAFINDRVVVTEQEVDDYLATRQEQDDNIQYQLSHIQVSLPEAAEAEQIEAAREKIQRIYRQLNEDADFSQLAVSHSDGRNALEGGDLGWRKLNQLPSAFIRTVTSLKVGEYSKPIRSPHGFHLLKLRDSQGIDRRVVKQVHARHILMSPNTLRNAVQTRAKLAEIRQQIANGADFSKMAAQHSEDSSNAESGGDLGWNQPDTFTPQFTRVVKNLPVNKISEPFKTPYGWHIVQVLGWRDYDQTVEYQRQQARQAIFQRKAALEEELWLRRLRHEAYIDYRLSDLQPDR